MNAKNYQPSLLLSLSVPHYEREEKMRKEKCCVSERQPIILHLWIYMQTNDEIWDDYWQAFSRNRVVFWLPFLLSLLNELQMPMKPDDLLRLDD